MPHWYRRVFDILKLLVLLTTRLQSSEISGIVFWTLSVSRWQKEDFDIRKSLVLPQFETDKL